MGRCYRDVVIGTLRRRRWTSLAAWVCTVVAAMAIQTSVAGANHGRPHFAGPFFSQQVTFGFERPIGMATAPSGEIFIVDDLGVVWSSLGGGAIATPIFDLSDHVNLIQDRGLISVAVDKNYALNRFIYLAYTFEDRTEAELDDEPSLANLPKTQRLVRVTVPVMSPDEPIQLEPEDSDGKPENDEHVVLGAYSSNPAKPGVPFSTSKACAQPSNLVSGDWSVANATDCIPSDSHEHTIDSVRVDPLDGTLWVSVGDGASGGSTLDPNSWRSQRAESYSGKLLHVGTDGMGLEGHPFCPAEGDLTKVCTKVYAKGFRNPFRFFLRPAPDGRPAVADAGWSTREELDLAEAGKNYGWPCREGIVPTPTWSERSECTALSPASFTDPVYDYPWFDGGAILGGVSYAGTSGPNDYPAEFKGAIFFSDFVTEQVQYLRLNEAGTGVAPGYPKVFADDLMAVDWATAANGDLMYVDIGFGVSGQAQVRQISFDAGNAPPEAIASADKTYGLAPLEVKFDASKSNDPDGDTLSFAWDLDGDGELDDSTSITPKWTYSGSDNVEVTLRVDDGNGHQAFDTILLFPDDRPPVPGFTGGPTTYRGGEPIGLTGSATDPDESLGAGDLSWNVKLDHAGTHIHPITSSKGVASVNFTTDTVHDAPSTYIVELTATDSRGLGTTTTRVLTPITRRVRIDSSPGGAPIAYGGTQRVAPYETDSTVGLVATLSAAPSFTQAGSLFEFQGWSDGGAAAHNIVVPDHDVALTAAYRLSSGGDGPDQATPDRVGPLIGFDAKHGLVRRGSLLRGSAEDPSGVRQVKIALRSTRKRAGRCLWWSRQRGDFAARPSSCAKPAFMLAQLKGSGERVNWVLPLGGRLPAGSYLLVFRTVDGAGNVGSGPKGSSPVSLRVK